MSELDAEDAKLVVLARGAMARAEATSGAAVRDLDGRTYAGAPVGLAALPLTALVPLLADWASAPIGLHIVTPPSALRPARVEALIAFLSQHLRDPCAGRD